MFRTVRRLYSTVRPSIAEADIKALSAWISRPNRLFLESNLSAGHLSDLFITLPTRDGSRRPYIAPQANDELPSGSHLAFFHPRNPESALRPDGTDADFCPPPPFTRRMWAGGKMTWDHRHPLRVGKNAVMAATVQSVDKKGFDSDASAPMVFVKQRMEIAQEGSTSPSVLEERTHVYLADTPDASRGAGARVPKEVAGLPAQADFSLKFTPSATTLFRFSALTFNGHHIHLDREYAQTVEGYPERLVHGPLTALLLLETAQLDKPDARFAQFEYRARNPLIVNQPLAIAGKWSEDGQSAVVWCVDWDGVVGMTGTIQLAQ